jgi:hypothetical protein
MGEKDEGSEETKKTSGRRIEVTSQRNLLSAEALFVLL